MEFFAMVMRCFLICVILSCFGGCEPAETPQKPQTPKEQADITKESEPPKEQADMAKESGPRVTLKTTKGDIIIELDSEKAPVTVGNFLRYVDEGFYNGTIFHRVISNFMIQGGGFTADKNQKATHGPITNEASNGLKNNRGTIAMARTSNPDSATCQFFINVVDNSSLNYAGPANPGYAVFGKVVEGMDAVDAIRNVKTANQGGAFANAPVEPVIIETASRLGTP